MSFLQGRSFASHLIILLVVAVLSKQHHLASAAAAATTDQRISVPVCSKILEELTPCAAFVKRGGTSAPSTACCSGVNDLKNIAKTNSDRQAICRCLKQVLPEVGNSYDPSRIPLLPKKCGVPLNLPPLDSKTDCAK
ncbi:hypothetical protein SAY87_013965 [Trapa incisa]|uniref:Non-specific lipid-transfer protein n=1 Tax=Trapa incisa TaxID=236973 RepID=A0AAN7GRY1_9MYRT|nr:hypothetical protein SAY87_013965 [Trapa incisa]